MKLHGLAFTVALVVAAGAGAVAQAQTDVLTWHWPMSLEAVNAAPNNHKILFENDHVRLLEVTIHAGEAENMHGHQYPSVFAIDAVQPQGENTIMADGSVRKIARGYENDTFPVCHTMQVQPPHSFHDVDTFQQHFYRLEFKTIDGKSIMNKP